jgi:hypothetical protein
MNINLKTEDKDIGGLRFTCTQFPALHATALFARLLKILGPALGAIMKLDPAAQLEDVALELASAFGALNPDDVPDLVLRILTGTAVLVPDAGGGRQIALNKKENIDAVFSGSLMTMFQATGFALQVNYRDFRSGGAPAAPGRA